MSNPYREAILATFPDLDRWQARRDVKLPEQTSALASDNAVFPDFLISEVARMSLNSAGEHLRLARDGIRQGQLYPSAHYTSLRGAFVGACQAVWILSPNDSTDRQQRGLTAISEVYRQLEVYYSARAAYESLSPSQRSALRDQQAWLKDRRAQIAELRQAENRLDLTNIVIAQALDYAFPDRGQRELGRRLWREMSGDAHVLGWPQFQRGTADGAEGMAELTVAGSWQTIAEPFLTSHLLLAQGWSLFDFRCESP